MEETTNKKTKEPRTEGESSRWANWLPLDEYRKLSGAARRKLNKERRNQGREAGAPGTRSIPKEAGQPGTSGTSAASASTSGGKVERGSKRNRSDSSTPKQKTKKSKGAEPTLSYKEACTGAKMVILPEGYPDTCLTEEQAEIIKCYLLKKIDELEEEGSAPRPKFADVRHKGGLLTVTCVDSATREWLDKTAKQCPPNELWEGAKLDLLEAKDVPKPVRTLAWIPGPKMEPKTILHRIAVQNAGVTTKSWKVVDTKPDPKGQQVVITMDERSWIKLQDLNCRPYINFSRVTFKKLGRREEDKEDEKPEGEEREPPEEEMDVEDTEKPPAGVAEEGTSGPPQPCPLEGTSEPPQN